jgi:hypothetical protein
MNNYTTFATKDQAFVTSLMLDVIALLNPKKGKPKRWPLSVAFVFGRSQYHTIRIIHAKRSRSKKDGLAGNRTPDHSHAKGVLYH